MRAGLLVSRLDVMPATVAKFRTNGDPETADLLEHIIYQARILPRLVATLGLGPLGRLRAVPFCARCSRNTYKSFEQACVHAIVLTDFVRPR